MLQLSHSPSRTVPQGAERFVMKATSGSLAGAVNRQRRASGLHFVRWLYSALAFCLALFSLGSTAQAAPIGMCSELGESIAAPPPLYAAKDIQLHGCETEEYEGWDVPASGRVPSGIDVPQEQPEKSFVLTGELIIIAAPLLEDESTAPLDLSFSEEHRGRLSRPPRH